MATSITVDEAKPRIFCIPRLHREAIENEANQFLILKGGRGGFKTTSICCALIEYSYIYQDCAFLFTREIAKSIQDSVYAVIVDLISQAGISQDFKIFATSIEHVRSGVKFIFTGLRSTGGKSAMSQINKVKGLHKLRLVFMEEGQDLSRDSLDVLLPTAVRKGGVKLHNAPQVDELANELIQARFFVAMNPNKKVDPVVAKFTPYVRAGKGQILHINMMDIVNDQPEFKDDGLINQMNLEIDDPYFDHIWNGAPFHKFAGLPFSGHNVASFDNINVHYSFIDPSFKGGDYTAIAFLGECNGKAVAFGRAFKQAWNMSPTIDTLCSLIRKYNPSKNWFEDNSLGTVPQSEFAKYNIKVIGHTNVLNKEDRIYKVAAYTKDLVHLAENHCDPLWF
jgi:PBSX family phage terminase large subunit